MAKSIVAIPALVLAALLTACSSTAHTDSLSSAHHSLPPAPPTPTQYTPPPAPAPTPDPKGDITTGGGFGAGCDVDLSSSLYGPNFLTAQVNAHNTGNIGIINRIRVSWPLQGFAPIVAFKTVRIRPGHTRQVEFNVQVTESQVGNFQDAQLATNGDPCHYRATITGTFGKVQG